jgi:hypothetical protein
MKKVTLFMNIYCILLNDYMLRDWQFLLLL